MFIYGDFSAQKARQLNIQLRRCRGHSYCESDANINEFFKSKYLLILMNQVRFNSKEYDDEVTVEESRML